MDRLRGTCLGLAALCLLLDAPMARAQAESARDLARDDQIAELRRQLDVVLEELDRMKTGMAVPEEPELVSSFGLGPAASKVYGVDRGLSIGGYAEGVYRNRVGADGNGDDTTDALRTVLYVGYKWNDWIVFNTELEFEHAGTSGGGSSSVELATLDFLFSDELNARMGLVLIPMGFVNEVHEPPFYFGTQRPEPERTIIPSTWRENGAGIFGSLGETLHYRAYVVNGLDGSGFSSSGLRDGRQKGSRTKANDLAIVGRFDWDLTNSWRIGGSYYLGDSGQDQRLPTTNLKLPDTRTHILEAHTRYQRGPLEVRALYTQANLSDARQLNNAFLAEGIGSLPVAERMIGGYVEAGYDLMQWLSPGSEQALVPFFRFEYLDTQNDVPRGFMRDRTRPRRIYVPGIQYLPHPNVVLKLDYRNIDDWEGTSDDEISVGFGLIF